MTDTQQHTPGEWVVEEFASVAEAKDAGGFEWADADLDLGPVGSVWLKTGHGSTGLPGSIETTLELAHLIAAAPDLFDALTALVTDWEQVTGWIDCPPHLRGAHPAHAAAVAAIAKAEGRTPVSQTEVTPP